MDKNKTKAKLWTRGINQFNRHSFNAHEIFISCHRISKSMPPLSQEKVPSHFISHSRQYTNMHTHEHTYTSVKASHSASIMSTDWTSEYHETVCNVKNVKFVKSITIKYIGKTSRIYLYLLMYYWSELYTLSLWTRLLPCLFILWVVIHCSLPPWSGSRFHCNEAWLYVSDTSAVADSWQWNSGSTYLVPQISEVIIILSTVRWQTENCQSL